MWMKIVRCSSFGSFSTLIYKFAFSSPTKSVYNPAFDAIAILVIIEGAVPHGGRTQQSNRLGIGNN
jgi:hypothetical protein